MIPLFLAKTLCVLQYYEAIILKHKILYEGHLVIFRMYCAHGSPIENCPVCRAHQQAKPAIQLIKPASREIPMSIPRKEELLRKEQINDQKLFTPSPSALRLIAPLQRNFAVSLQNQTAPPSLFQIRSEKLSADLPDLSADISLTDLRKKFTQN